jgi:protein phosphatase
MNESFIHHIHAAGRSDIGLQRSINQDAYRTQIPAPSLKSNHALFVVADGVGGNLPHGEVASRTAVDALVEAYFKLPETTDSLSRAQQAVQSAHQSVRQKASALSETMIGTTLAGVALTPAGEAVVFNVGDSRVYRVRSKIAEQISQDQVLSADPNVIKDEFREKRITKVASYLGQPKPLEPNFYRLKVQPDDIFVICTDGIWSVVGEQELREVVTRMPPDAAADHLIGLVKQRNASDNLTLIVVRLTSNGAVGSRRNIVIVLLVLLLLIGIVAALLASNPARF